MAINLNKTRSIKTSRMLDVRMIEDYLELQSRIKSLTEKFNDIKTSIKDQIKDAMPDEKGNIVIEVGPHTVKHEARTSVTLNEPLAEEYLRRRGLWETARKEVIDQDKFEMMIINKVIPEHDVEELANRKTTYALKIT